MTTQLWHDNAIHEITALLQANEVVQGLVLTGSCARDDVQPDEWSDLDFTLVIKDSAYEQFFPSTDWLAHFNEIYATAQHSDAHLGVLRAFFTDGRSMDFVIIRESALSDIDNWSHNPIAYEVRCLFSRSDALDKVLARVFDKPLFIPPTSECFEQLANTFWFKGMLAAAKVARGDLLIALHLSLDMVRDCAVLAMILRDREKGTNHHRYANIDDPIISEFETTRQVYTAKGILRSMEQSAILFDNLAARWMNDYIERRGPLLDFIHRIAELLNRNEKMNAV